MKKIIGVLFGGKSTEHEVSIHSAQSIVDALDPVLYDIVPLALTKNNHLVSKGGTTSRESIMEGGKAVLAQQCVLPQDEFDALPLAVLTRNIVDVVLPVMHGNFGEDGRLQGFLEMQDIPYVGSGVLGSAVGMDKLVQKQLTLHLPHVPFVSMTMHEWEQDAEALTQDIEQTCGFPCFVKPANNGSSVGISKVRSKEELETAVVAAFVYDTRVIVEKGIEHPREFEVAVRGHRDIEVAEALAEITYGSEFYDYDTKYDPTVPFEVLLPAKVSDPQRQEIRDIAAQVYTLIHASGLSRVDFLMDGAGKVYFNELNTLPSFTAASTFARMWEAQGVTYGDLLTSMIDAALQRHEEKNAIHYEA